MASVYICQVTGDGLTTETVFRPSGFDAKPFAVLMLSETKLRAIVVSSDDTVTGTGITLLLTGATWSALVQTAQTTNPSTTRRTAINTWLTNAGLTALTAAQVTWWDCVQYVARQVNPVADLAVTTC